MDADLVAAMRAAGKAIAKRDALQAKLDDDAIVERVMATCTREEHHPAWCAYCEARRDGIDQYRQALAGAG